MENIVAVGLDIAKSVFQVHAVDGEGKVVTRQPDVRPTHWRYVCHQGVGIWKRFTQRLTLLSSFDFLITRIPDQIRTPPWKGAS